jgi:hypothetical protein
MIKKKTGVWGSVLLLIALTFLVQSVYAVGITIRQEAILISEGETGCVAYGVFNSKGENISVSAVPSSEIAQFFAYSNPDVLDVPGETERGEALPLEVCFSVPEDFYSEDRSCLGEQEEFEGFVNLIAAGEGGSGGSATAFPVRGGLSVRVKCVPNPFNYTLALLIASIVLAIAIILLLILRPKSSKVKPAAAFSSGDKPAGARESSDAGTGYSGYGSSSEPREQ